MSETENTGADVREKVSEVAGQAQEKAGEAASQAKSQVRTQVDQRSTQAGEMASSTAQDMRSVSQHLRTQQKEGAAKLVDRAADQAERLGSYLTGSDGDRILHDVEDLGRRKPWVVVAGGVAIGFTASRFLKASSETRYRSLSYGSNGGTTPRFSRYGQEGRIEPIGTGRMDPAGTGRIEPTGTGIDPAGTGRIEPTDTGSVTGRTTAL